MSGEVHHRDTLGNSGGIGAGDIQWMTSGRGILHEEMPQVRPEGIAGFQLWVNLPASVKMTKPKYQDIRSGQIPEIDGPEGTRIRIVAGTVNNVTGPVTGIAADPTYVDVLVPPKSQFVTPVPRAHNAFAYVFEGKGSFGAEHANISAPRLVVWEDGDSMEVATADQPVRFLLVSGKPLHEPVARYGPFVMNTKEEIEQALLDLQRGTFV